MWELDHKEGSALKNWCFQTVVLKKTLESPLDCKIKPVNPKGNQPWILIGRTEAEAETLILWAPDVNRWLTGKDLDAGKDWRQKEKETAKDKMIRYHHQLNGHEFEQTPGDSEGQRSLIFCSPWGRRVGHNLATEQQQHFSYCFIGVFFFLITSWIWVLCQIYVLSKASPTENSLMVSCSVIYYFSLWLLLFIISLKFFVYSKFMMILKLLITRCNSSFWTLHLTFLLFPIIMMWDAFFSF